ncbi:unnamed protein product [Soboliphyme baturini]|uniref:SCP domain-containing protein n=1 Tax=Soboliphyme baturini TaxID=241478 RepID=A0A183J2Z0_9BILA|nr:unnamed protein product [Soboliphyme baturini]
MQLLARLDPISVTLFISCFVKWSSCMAWLSTRSWSRRDSITFEPLQGLPHNAGRTLLGRLKRSYNLSSATSSKYWYQSLPVDDKAARMLVDEHNKYRRMIRASNMMLMTWSRYSASNAQKHADRCLFQHSSDRYNSGENIWAAPFANFSGAVNLWFNEIFDRHCGCTNAYKACCGHYTQVL